MFKHSLVHKQGLFTLLVAVLLPGGCGTQTGNPPTQTHTTKLFEQSVSTGLINGIYSELIDNINLGEYAYSSTESRVINQLSCQLVEDAGLSLQKETETEHSVQGQVGDRQFIAQLHISRQYLDTWYQDGQLIPCNPESGAVGVRLEAGEELRLSSQVDETRRRELRLLDQYGLEITQNFVEIQKSGNRISQFAMLASTDDQLQVSAKLEEQAITRHISTIDEGGESISFPLNALPESDSSLEFEISLEPGTRLLRSYFIESVSMHYDLGEDQEIVIHFEDMLIEPSRHCFPSQGNITGHLRQGGSKESFSLSFDAESSQFEFTTDQGRKLLFVPEACVLNER
ncbi:MAG: hypothetical protein ACOH5I_07460 [Oligoflexus sp.]